MSDSQKINLSELPDLIVNTLPHPACYLDPHGIIQGHNKSYADANCQKGILVGKCFAELLNNNTIKALLDEYARTGTAISKIVSDDTARNTYTLFSISPIKLEDKKFSLVTEQNVTSNLAAKNAEFLNYFQTILDHIPANIYWKDKDSVLIGTNTTHTDLCGFDSSDDIIGKTDFDFSWKEKASEIIANDQAVMDSGKKLTFEEQAFLPNKGKEHTFLSIKAPLYNQNGDVSGILGVSIDINERKELERALRAEKEKAEEASKAKSEFIENMSHDIRTPVTGILGIAQSLQENPSADSIIREDGKMLASATEELLNLLNDVLDMTRHEHQLNTPEKKKFVLNKLIAHNTDLIKPALSHKKLEFQCTIDDAVPNNLHGDYNFLNRILLNLLSNAIKFTDKGSVKLAVKLDSTLDDTVILKFSVSDTGIGIPEDKREVIFNYFTRLTASSQGLYKGSGLGLFSVRKYLDSMGGGIELESEEGKGSCFTVTIPFQLTDSAEEFDPKIAVEAQDQKNITTRIVGDKTLISSSNVPDDTGSKTNFDEFCTKILLVEDNLLAARMARQLLTNNFSCEVDEAHNGSQALQKASENSYDIIFMDIGLPDTDGITVAKQIRNLPTKKLASTPIFALTGHAKESKKNECMQAGMQDVFTKPLTIPIAEEVFNSTIPNSGSTISYGEDSPAASISGSAISDSQNLPIIDIAEGMELIAGDEAAAKEIIEMLASELPGDMAILTAAFEKKDFTEMYSAIHKIYGGLCYCGTPRLRKVSADLKFALADNKTENICALFNTVKAATKEFISELSDKR